MSTDDDTPVGRVAAAYDRLIGRFVTWAEAEPDVRAAFVVGSRARVDTPADEWSDLDLVIVMTDPNRLLRRSEWLRNLGTVWVTYLEPTAVGAGMERRVLFEGGLDVDFVPTPLDLTTQIAEHGWPSDLVAVARRGIRFVLDKDGLASRLPALPEAPRAVAPSEDQYASTVDDFWYHTVWVAKKLRRGELWTAKMGCDGYLKGLNLRMAEWHAGADSDWTRDTWHEGRFLDQWADPRVTASLPDAFAHYDQHDVVRALGATMRLFRWLAVETGERLGYAYPSETDRHTTALVSDYLERSPSTRSTSAAPSRLS